MRNLLMLWLMFLFLLGFTAVSNALTVSYDDTGKVHNVAAVDGEGMDGMTVTVAFSDGSVKTETWKTTGDKSGAATGAGWSLSETESDFNKIWTLSSSLDEVGITSVFIDAGAGNTVFDVVSDSDVSVSTSGSGKGSAFQLSSEYNEQLEVNYSGRVALDGQEVVGDLYRFMDLDFGGSVFYGVDSLYFIADIDSVKIMDSDEYGNPVPEPATIFLLGVGILGVAGVRRKIK